MNQLIQNYNCKFEQGTLNKFSLIIEGLLQQAVQSNLQVHVNTMGPGEWMSKWKASEQNPHVGARIQVCSSTASQAWR